MSKEKLTANEMAERNTNALVRSGVASIPKPPLGIGAEFCITCDEPIEQARREIAGYTNCFDCASYAEK